MRSSESCPTSCCSTCGLPGEDGLTLARYLREHYDLGIIMVTASADVIDRVVGLELGADDYIAKPFDPRELLARVKSVLRRCRRARRPKPTLPTGAGRHAAARLRPLRSSTWTRAACSTPTAPRCR